MSYDESHHVQTATDACNVITSTSDTQLTTDRTPTSRRPPTNVLPGKASSSELPINYTQTQHIHWETGNINIGRGIR